MAKISGGAVALLAAGVFASALSAQSPPGAAAQPAVAAAQGMTYDSLKELPDFTGWWSLTPESIAGALAPAPPPLKPRAAAVMKEWTAKTAAGQDPADVDGLKRSYCGSARFSGFNGGLQDFIEVLFTPGRVTIANELGLVRQRPIS